MERKIGKNEVIFISLISLVTILVIINLFQSINTLV